MSAHTSANLAMRTHPQKSKTASGRPSISILENDRIRNSQSFIETFYERVKLHPDKTYLRQASGNKWEEYTWAEVYDMAARLVSGLQHMGLRQGDHVGILSKNCYAWIVADLAIMMGGFVSVPFYPTLSKKDLREVIELSDIKALFVGKLDVWKDQKGSMTPELITIAFPHFEGNSDVSKDCLYHWNHIQKDYPPCKHPHHPDPKEVFTIIYTSGTTGTPKGVMIDYDCANQVLSHERADPAYGVFQGVSERVLSYLPLNHIAERVVSEISPIIAGSEVSFSESIEQFAANLQSVQPTQFFAVPRIWTKIQQGILSKVPERKLDTLLKIPLAGSMIRKKIRKGIGLAEVRSAVSGAAPLSASLIQWYMKLGINIQEVYGATELCGGVTFNKLKEIKPGTVGKPLYGVDIEIDQETDEVLIRTPWVMKGYYKAPEKTAEVLTSDGWYRTGDTGRLDESGNLVITGRVKDTFKTAKGKFILPVPIEQKLGANFLIGQVMVTGFGLTQPIAHVSLSESAQDLSEEQISDRLLSTLETVNKELESYSRVSHMIVHKTPWAEDSGFFTPTLKIKRHVVDAAFKDNYEKWSASSKPLIWV